MNDKQESFKQLFTDNITTSDSIAIVGHLGPDDDAIGSLLSLRSILVEHLRVDSAKISCYVEGSIADRWDSFPNRDLIKSVDNLSEELSGFSDVVFVDGNEFHRFSEHELDVKATTWCIDHHPYEEVSFDYFLIDDSAKATCQLLGEIFLDDQHFSKSVAEPMLMGILGDTGNFRYVDEHSSKVFLIAEKLVRIAGIDVQKLQSIYSVTKAEEFALFSKLMGNATIISVGDNPAFMYSLLSSDEVEGFSDELISGAGHMFVSWVTRIQDVGWGFVLTPRSTGRVAISLRSIPGSVSVRSLAAGMEIGGGHQHASGGRFDDMSTVDALKQIITYLGDNRLEITD